MKRITTTLIAMLALVTLSLAPTAVADHPESKPYILSVPVTFESSVVHYSATLTIVDDNFDSIYTTIAFYLNGNLVDQHTGCGLQTTGSPGGWDKAVVRTGPATIDANTFTVCPGGTTGTITLIAD